MKNNKTKDFFLILAITGSLFGLYLLVHPENVPDEEACECTKPEVEIPTFIIP